MAVSPQAMTLADYALMSNDPLITAVVFNLRESGSIMADIPFITKPTLIMNGARWTGNLPSVNWTKVNGEGTTTKGTPDKYQESIFVIRNNIDVDHLLVEDQNQVADPRGLQLAAYLKSVAYDFNDKFFNNSHETGNADAIVGMRTRLDNPAKYGASSVNKLNAGALVMTSAMTQANANAFLELLDSVLYALEAPMGDGVILYMNEILKRRFATALRLLGPNGGFSNAQDQFGRTIEKFRNAEVRDAGLKADQSTRIITATEAADGTEGASNYTSLYGVRFGSDYLSGWQFAPLNAKNIGLMENGMIYRTFIEWAGGLNLASVRSVARAYGIKTS